MRILYIVLFSLMLFSSCSYKQDQVLFATKDRKADSTITPGLANIMNYKIRPQDIVQITNVQNSKNIIDLSAGLGTAGNLSTGNSAEENYLVEDDGTIALTGLGRVSIAGLTRVEARTKIEGLYSKDLKQPLLELKIINLKVSVLGEVRNPGNLPLVKDRTTVIEIIGDAGGLTPNADEQTVKIIRQDEYGKPIVTVIDLGNINAFTDPRGRLQNGDVIYVAQNRKAIRNDKISTFSSVMQPALLLFNTALIIFTLVRR